MRRMALVVVSWLAVAAVVTGCAPEPPAPEPEPSPPESIAGDGTSHTLVFDPWTGLSERVVDATFSLHASGDGVYEGSMVTDSYEYGVSVSTSGRDIVGVYSSDYGVYNATINSVTTVMDAARCPGTAALRFRFSSSLGEYLGAATWTICDPVAAEWFG